MLSQQEKTKPPKSSTQGRDYSKSKLIAKISAAISTLATTNVSSSTLATSIPKVSSSTSATKYVSY